MCTIAGASTVDSEALSASITPLRTYNPIIPLLHRITSSLPQLQLSLPYTHTLYHHPDYHNTTNDTDYDYYYRPLPPPTTDNYHKVMQTFFQEPGLGGLGYSEDSNSRSQFSVALPEELSTTQGTSNKKLSKQERVELWRDVAKVV